MFFTYVVFVTNPLSEKDSFWGPSPSCLENECAGILFLHKFRWWVCRLPCVDIPLWLLWCLLGRSAAYNIFSWVLRSVILAAFPVHMTFLSETDCWSKITRTSGKQAQEIPRSKTRNATTQPPEDSGRLTPPSCCRRCSSPSWWASFRCSMASCSTGRPSGRPRCALTQKRTTLRPPRDTRSRSPSKLWVWLWPSWGCWTLWRWWICVCFRYPCVCHFRACIWPCATVTDLPFASKMM